MKRTPKVLILLFLFIFFPANCSKANQDWTFAFYLAGENTLELQQVNNLMEVIKGNEALKNPNVIVLLDKGNTRPNFTLNWAGTRVFKTSGAFREIIKSPVTVDIPAGIEKSRFDKLVLKNVNDNEKDFLMQFYSLKDDRYFLSYDPDKRERKKIRDILTGCGYLLPLFDDNTNLRASSYIAMRQFFSFVMDNFITGHYAFFISGHGNGWFFKEYTGPAGALEPDKISEKYDAIDAYNIKKALEYNRPDILALDMCLMSDIETICQLRSSAKYIVLNQSIIPAAGLDYYVLLKNIKKNNPAGAEELTEEIADSYRTVYKDSQYAVSTIGLKYGGNFDSFYAHFNQFLDRLSRQGTPHKNNSVLRLPPWSDKSYNMIDLISFIESNAKSKNDLNMVKEIAAFTVKRFSVNTGLSGISIFYPVSGKFFYDNKRIYKELDFSIDTNCAWEKYLESGYDPIDE